MLSAKQTFSFHSKCIHGWIFWQKWKVEDVIFHFSGFWLKLFALEFGYGKECKNINECVRDAVSLSVCLTIMVGHQEKTQFQPPPAGHQTLASYPKQISALFNQAATNQNID